jgi:hypothetical protein
VRGGEKILFSRLMVSSWSFFAKRSEVWLHTHAAAVHTHTRWFSLHVCPTHIFHTSAFFLLLHHKLMREHTHPQTDSRRIKASCQPGLLFLLLKYVVGERARPRRQTRRWKNLNIV